MKVTFDPAQIEVLLGAADTEGVRLGLTVTAAEVPEAVALVTHVSFDVKTTATTSPLAKLASA